MCARVRVGVCSCVRVCVSAWARVCVNDVCARVCAQHVYVWRVAVCLLVYVRVCLPRACENDSVAVFPVFTGSNCSAVSCGQPGRKVPLTDGPWKGRMLHAKATHAFFGRDLQHSLLFLDQLHCPFDSPVGPTIHRRRVLDDSLKRASSATFSSKF